MWLSMNEERTKDLTDKKSFEERIFARFDSVDARLDKLESSSYDTKPIWERALAAIMETGLEVGEIKTKVHLLENEIGALRIGVRNELVDVRRELKHNVRERLDLIFKFLLEDRDDIRDAEERIRELESKSA
jgi:uncharacterized coiled-coil protein SlyX